MVVAAHAVATLVAACGWNAVNALRFCLPRPPAVSRRRFRLPAGAPATPVGACRLYLGGAEFLLPPPFLPACELLPHSRCYWAIRWPTAHAWVTFAFIYNLPSVGGGGWRRFLHTLPCRYYCGGGRGKGITYYPAVTLDSRVTSVPPAYLPSSPVCLYDGESPGGEDAIPYYPLSLLASLRIWAWASEGRPELWRRCLYLLPLSPSCHPSPGGGVLTSENMSGGQTAMAWQQRLGSGRDVYQRFAIRRIHAIRSLPRCQR